MNSAQNLELNWKQKSTQPAFTTFTHLIPSSNSLLIT